MLDTTTRSTTMGASIGDRNTVDEENAMITPDPSATPAGETLGAHCVALVIGAFGGWLVAGVSNG